MFGYYPGPAIDLGSGVVATLPCSPKVLSPDPLSLQYLSQPLLFTTASDYEVTFMTASRYSMML